MSRLRLILAIAAIVACFAGPALAQQAPAGVPQPTAHGRLVHTHFTLHNTDVARLLRRLRKFGLRVPIEISGRATTRVDLAVPIRDVFRARDYQIAATIDSPRLLIAGQDLRRLHAKLEYADGLLTLAGFGFELPPQPGEVAAAGRVSGNGEMRLVPRGDLNVHLQMHDVLADRLGPHLAVLAGAHGRLNGEVSAKAAVTGLKNPAAWHADGQLSLAELALPGTPAVDGDIRFNLDHGTVRISRLEFRAGNAKVDGHFQAHAAAPYAFQGSLVLAIPQLADWQPWLTRFAILPAALRGELKATANAAGTLSPLSFGTIAGTLDAAQLALGHASVDRLHADLVTDGRTAVLRNLRASLYGGTAEATIAAPLAKGGEIAMDASWSAIQLARLAELAPVLGVSLPVGGTAAGRLSARIPLEHIGDVSVWSASGSLALAAVEMYGSHSNRLTADIALSGGRASIARLAGDMDGGRISGSAAVEIAAPHRARVALKLVDADMAPLNSLPVARRLPGPLGGRYSIGLEATGTLQPPAVEARGGFVAVGMTLKQARIDHVSFVFRGSKDSVQIGEFQATLLGGSAAGNARLPLAAAAGPGEVNLRWRGVDLASIQAFAPQLPRIRGRATGNVQLAIPAGKLNDWSQWTGEGAADVAGLGVRNAELGVLSAAFALHDKQLQATRIALSGPLATIEAGAQCGLAAPFNYAGHLQVDRTNLAALAALPQLAARGSMSGQLTALVDLHGTLKPFAASGTANVSGANLLVGRLEIDRAQAQAHFDRRRIELRAAELVLYGGRAAASGTIDLDGPSRLEAKVQQLDLARLAAAAGVASGHLRALAEGTLTLDVAAGQLPKPESWRAHASFEIPKLLAGQQYLGTLSATADYRQRELAYDASGELLGGAIHAVGTMMLPAGNQPFTPGKGQVSISGAQLDQLAMLSGRPALTPLSGRFSASVNFHPPLQGQTATGAGAWSLADIRWRDKLLIPRLAGGLRANGSRIELLDTQGTVAGGTLLIGGGFELGNPLASSFRLQWLDVQLAQLGALASVKLPLRGTLDLVLRGNLARPWQFAGNAMISDADVSGIRIADARMMLAAEVDPLTATGQFAIEQASAAIANGRATGKLRADFRGELGLEASATFSDLDLRALSGPLSSAGRMVNGRISGSVAASGHNLRSLADLRGTVRLTLNQAQAMSLPVLDRVEPFLSAGLSSATTFNQGQLVGSFSGGVLRIGRFTLSSNSMQLFADGTITEAGRLNLNVTARTGQQAPGGILSPLVLAELPLVGPTPVGWLIEANRLLANQVIHLVVTGTIKNPSISIRPVPLLGEQAVRFFLLQAPGAAAVVP